MDLFEALLLTLLVGIVGPLLTLAAKSLAVLAATVIVVREQAQVSTLDRLLAESGWCSARTLAPGRPPAEGAHFLFLRGPVVAIRTRTATDRGGERLAYTLYAFGRAPSRAVSERLTGDPRDVSLRYVYAPAPWRVSAVTMQAAPPPRAYSWQQSAVRELLAAYGSGGRAAMLVCGGPGAGKSTLGELFAVALKTERRVSAEVVKNLDLCARGLLLEDVYDTPVAGAPVIVMLDEFDATVDHAERPDRDGKTEGTSLADTPTALLSLLDRLNRTAHLVVIATTNRQLEEMRGGSYARYTRGGRLDLHVSAGEAQRFCAVRRRAHLDVGAAPDSGPAHVLGLSRRGRPD